MSKRQFFIISLAALIAIMASVASVSAQQGGFGGPYCPGALPLRLQVNGLGQVTPGLPNVIRTQPYRGADSVIIGEIPAGGVFSIYGGPSCFDGMWWWYVGYNGLFGWTPEGSNGGIYWTTPYSTLPPTPYPQPCPMLPQINLTGYTGRVTPGLPNRLRAEPSTYGAFLRNIPSGDTFIYVGGATCAEGMYWWQVNYRGTIGWTAQGQNSTWIEPVICPGFTYSRLAAGTSARVTPGLPNNLRAYPSLASYVQAVIPAGGRVSVLEGPICADNMAWWRVRYGYFEGWTSEGQGATYWLTP